MGLGWVGREEQAPRGLGTSACASPSPSLPPSLPPSTPSHLSREHCQGEKVRGVFALGAQYPKHVDGAGIEGSYGHFLALGIDAVPAP
jgi:hypothetical protein